MVTGSRTTAIGRCLVTDDTQAREDWEGLTAAMRSDVEALAMCGDAQLTGRLWPRRDASKLVDLAIAEEVWCDPMGADGLPLPYARPRVGFRLTLRGQRCAAYGRSLESKGGSDDGNG